MDMIKRPVAYSPDGLPSLAVLQLIGRVKDRDLLPQVNLYGYGGGCESKLHAALFGVKFPFNDSCPTKVSNDNFSVVQNAQNPAVDLSKKHVAISYHIMRETVAAGIIEPYWISGGFNMSDILTKQIPKPKFIVHCKYIFCQPDFHLLRHNRLSEACDDLMQPDFISCWFERRCSVHEG